MYVFVHSTLPMLVLRVCYAHTGQDSFPRTMPDYATIEVHAINVAHKLVQTEFSPHPMLNKHYHHC